MIATRIAFDFGASVCRMGMTLELWISKVCKLRVSVACPILQGHREGAKQQSTCLVCTRFCLHDKKKVCGGQIWPALV